MRYGNILREILKRKNKFVISVKGNSMYPTFLEGENVEITNPHDLEKGDVVLFENYNFDLIFHRIEYISNRYVITRGDNHEFRDDMIERNSIVAKACERRFDFLNITEKIPIIFNFCNEVSTLKKLSEEIINYSAIRVSNKNELDRKDNNILIHPAGNEKIAKDIFCGDRNNVIHFNTRVSNLPRQGYVQLGEFDHIVYITNPIINSIVGEEHLTFLILGALNDIIEE